MSRHVLNLSCVIKEKTVTYIKEYEINCNPCKQMDAQNYNNSSFLFIFAIKCILVLTSLAHANSFVCSIRTQYKHQQPGTLKSLVISTYIYVLGCWYYNWALFLWCPKVYKCNCAAKEICIQQPNIYIKSLDYMRTFIHVVGC